MNKATKGAKLVTAAMLGLDGETIVVGGHAYYVQPPTIKRLAGCGYYLSDFSAQESVADFFKGLKSITDASKALSWLICGDESKVDELSEGTLEEVVMGIETGLSLIGTENFTRLLASSRSVAKLIAKPRQ